MVDTGNNNLFPSALALLVLVVVVCCVADPSNGRLWWLLADIHPMRLVSLRSSHSLETKRPPLSGFTVKKFETWGFKKASGLQKNTYCTTVREFLCVVF
jgi:hypothetical protein